MFEWLDSLFGTGPFMPHGHCYLWNENLVRLHVTSDAIIFLSYVTIPITLVEFIRKRKDLPFSWMFALFAVFIVACGVGHLVEIITLWHPYYWFSGYEKAVTAVSSIGTAIVLRMKVMPAALALPSPELLRQNLAEKELLLKEVDRQQRQLADVSRKAGMADVATNLLHNVGNALNTVNVVSDRLKSTTEGSKVPKIGEAIMLLKVNPDAEARGKILDYLGVAIEAVEGDRRLAMADLELLSKNIDHVKTIVSLQQSHAKPAGVVERVDVAVLIEDALQFNSASYDEHEVKVIREIAPRLELQSDRHKLLAILMNLLSNARHAVRGRDGERRITMRAMTIQGSGDVQIEVEDNGVGIPDENLEKIFGQGFTTKPEGHGFGLHASACAATELGGSLSAYSGGMGKGSRFTLVVPSTVGGASLVKHPVGPAKKG